MLAAIAADLAPLRAVNAAEAAVLNTLIKLLRDPDIDPEAIDEAISWLATTGKRRMLQALIDAHKLRPLPPRAHDAATLARGFTPEDRAALELIHLVITASDEALIADAHIDLRGYQDLEAPR